LLNDFYFLGQTISERSIYLAIYHLLIDLRTPAISAHRLPQPVVVVHGIHEYIRNPLGTGYEKVEYVKYFPKAMIKVTPKTVN